MASSYYVETMIIHLYISSKYALFQTALYNNFFYKWYFSFIKLRLTLRG